ncbi:MAG: hypothetical protein LBP95_13170 [Deltaproteobacteria bacterium]|jgi:two-component system sensor histidine kinase PilS (NtrC family)|nr:hypothetical protein [Deltaproteobacteria bacterium]
MSESLWLPQSIELNSRRWLLFLRLLTATFICLAVTLLYLNGRAPAIFDFWTRTISIVLAAAFLLALFHYFLLPKYFSVRVQVVVQMICDNAFAGVIIILTGGCESTFNFVLLVGVVNSAFLGGLRISVVSATLAAATWAGLSDLHYYGYLPGLPPLGEYVGANELAVTILINAGASYLVAILAGHLSTQLRLSSQALISSQTSLDRLSQLNESIIHSIDSGLITTDDRGLVLTVNPAGRDLLRPQRKVVGQPWRSLFPELENYPNQTVPGTDEEAYHQIMGLRFKHVRPSDKAELNIELSSLALTDVHNVSWGRLLVFKDQTAMIQMEADIKRSEHMAAVGQLAAGLAHEIRTPLASMSGSWHMILSQSVRPEDQRRLMTIIGREMERLENLVGDFLSFAKPSAGNPQSIDLNSLIDDQSHIFTSWQGDKAVIELRLNDVPKVYFDYSQLSQVIFNLIQNAFEAAIDGRPPRVVVDTSYDRLNGDYAAVEIADNGGGISEENIRRIFEPFFTTKQRGNGLGLAMVWGIIMRGNGHISVRSTPDVGTVFTVYLPVAKDPGPRV